MNHRTCLHVLSPGPLGEYNQSINQLTGGVEARYVRGIEETNDSSPEAIPTASLFRGHKARGISQDYLWVSAAAVAIVGSAVSTLFPIPLVVMKKNSVLKLSTRTMLISSVMLSPGHRLYYVGLADG